MNKKIELRKTLHSFRVSYPELYPGYHDKTGWSKFWELGGYNAEYGKNEAAEHALELSKEHPDRQYFVYEEITEHKLVAKVEKAINAGNGRTIQVINYRREYCDF